STYGGVQGGDPLPYDRNKDVKVPQAAPFITTPYDVPTANTCSWNVAVQRQVGTSWFASATYIGSRVMHLYVNVPINQAVFVAPALATCAATATNCSSTANIQARRVL